VSFVVVWQGAQVYSSPILVLFDVINQLTGVFLLLTFLSKKNHRKQNKHHGTPLYTDKKEKQIFLLYKEIQNGAVAKSYMTNSLLIYLRISSYIRKPFLMTLQLLHSEFPYI
jgi:hypothetical protein